MREIDHPPDAPSLMESMRSMGYSLESALADLVDNSLAAKAKQVAIEFRPEPLPYVAIFDDGEGMTQKELERAMRHGSTNPNALRAESDLGRYGLGLKTASLSQCRTLTVVSLKDGKVSGYRWDLDLVLERGAWTLLKLDSKDFAELPHFDELKQSSSGTLVVWHGLDRMLAGEHSVTQAMGRLMTIANDHLSLVFHRYIEGAPGHPAVAISFNKRPLNGIDPFLEKHSATQRLAEDAFQVERGRVTVKPFVLPHLSKLSSADIARAGGGEGLRHQQGFYVYRNRRLIVWGTWFRLAKKDELSKLARVRVDIPNSLDHLWTIDVKKSAALPPETVRRNLQRTIERIRQASGRTLVFRGRKSSEGPVMLAWNEVTDRDGVRFDINRSHPVIEYLRHGLNAAASSKLEAVLRVLEVAFPADALYARLASDQRPKSFGAKAEPDVRALLAQIFGNWSGGEHERRALLDGLHLIEPFSAHPELSRKLAKELLEQTSDADNTL